MKTESIIFDLDGTLWDSSENVAVSWTDTIKSCGNSIVRNMTVTGEDIRKVMGMTMDAIAEKLFPMLSPYHRNELMEKCIAAEQDYLALKGGTLFEGAEKTLSALAENHRLFIVSNCQCGYIEAFFEYCGLERLFTDYLCWGETLKPKGETIKQLMAKNHCTDAVYVGDTQGDCDAAHAAGIPFIHAAYGFGKITTGDAAASVSDICSLTEIFG